MGMLTEYHNYILTSLDMHTLDLREFQRTRCNLTAFHVLGTEVLPLVPREHTTGEYLFSIVHQYSPTRRTKMYVKLDAALVHDAVFAFSHGVQALSRVQSLTAQHSAACENDDVWTNGLTLTTLIKAGCLAR